MSSSALPPRQTRIERGDRHPGGLVRGNVRRGVQVRARVDRWVLAFGSHDGQEPFWVLLEDGATRGAFPRTEASVLMPKLAPVAGKTVAERLTEEAERQMVERVGS